MAAINIIGTVGAGKTTLASKLQQATKLPVGYEADSEELNEETRSLLKKYYANPQKYALEKNLFFLKQRKNTLFKNIINQAYISDRFLYDDFVMALLNLRNNQMTEDEWNTYESEFNEVENIFYHDKKSIDDILIFIKPGFDHALAQIKKRGRKEEQVTNHPELKEYYRDMYDLYLEIFKNWKTTPIIVVEHVEEIDINALVQEIKEKQPAFNTLIP